MTVQRLVDDDRFKAVPYQIYLKMEMAIKQLEDRGMMSKEAGEIACRAVMKEYLERNFGEKKTNGTKVDHLDPYSIEEPDEVRKYLEQFESYEKAAEVLNRSEVNWLYGVIYKSNMKTNRLRALNQIKMYFHGIDRAIRLKP